MFFDESAKHFQSSPRADKKLKLFHCRFCTKQKTYEELLDLTKDTKVFDKCLKIIKFFKIDYIDLSRENLPKTACKACYEAMQNSYMFFENVKYSQVVLTGLFNVNMKWEDHDTPIKKMKIINYQENDFKGNFEEIHQNDIEVLNPEIKTPVDNSHSLFENSNEPKTQIDTNFCSEIITSYCDLPILDDAEKTEKNLMESEDLYFNDSSPIDDVDDYDETGNSWTSYQWLCHHCSLEFKSMAALRAHSREEHNACFAFNCVDCGMKYNTFNAFIEHVRQHRDELRYYCQYCNKKYHSEEQCMKHAISHWKGKQKICDLCGDIFPDKEALERHKKLYKKIGLPRRYHNTKPDLIVAHDDKSWDDYEWACQECYVRAADVHSLREHVRRVHDKCFAIKCMDCLRVMRNYRRFITHATAHRPYLKKYCQYCNMHFEDISKLNEHINNHLTGPQKPCHGCGQIFQNNLQMSRHMKEYNAPRCEGVLTTEDLTCDICFKVFKDILRFRSHRKTHEDKKLDYTCETCGKAFHKSYFLTAHMKTHSDKTEICQVCTKRFHTKQKLKAHVATHSDERPFICNECGNTYKTKVRLKQHLISHMDIKKFKCTFCFKEFKFKYNLKNHEYQHTGLRPYSCQVCERTFTNWANCNKHMIRKHGVTMAKSKVTAQGKLEINRETGQPRKIASDRITKEWLNEILKPQKRGKKTTK